MYPGEGNLSRIIVKINPYRRFKMKTLTLEQKKNLVFATIMIAATALVLILSKINVNAAYTGPTPSGYTKPAELNSVGRMIFAGNDGETGTADDIIFDAQDLYYLYEFCK